MLLPLFLMEDELEEGEIIEKPLLPTPHPLLVHKHLKQDSKCNKTVKHFSSFSNSTFKSHVVNKRKPHVCKSRKKNFSKNVPAEYVRVVKYKVTPCNIAPYKSRNIQSKQNLATKITRNVAKESSEWKDHRSFPKRYRDPLFEDLDYNKDSSYEDLLNQYKSIQSQLKSLREGTKCDNKKVLKSNDVKYLKDKSKKRKLSKSPEKPKLSESNKKSEKSPTKISIVEVQNKNTIEEEEDLDLLRQAALASRAKLPSFNPLLSTDHDIINDNLHLNSDILQSMVDNYDVVDMEVSDDDIMDDIDQEILSEHDLNVLKSSILEENINDDFPLQFSESDNSNNEDDDLLMLRTKLLAEMQEKQKLNHTKNDIDESNVRTNVECCDQVTCPENSEYSADNASKVICNEEIFEPFLSTDNVELPSSSNEECKKDLNENMSLVLISNSTNDNCQEYKVNTNEFPLENESIVKPDENTIIDALLKSNEIVEHVLPNEPIIINKEIEQKDTLMSEHSIFNSESTLIQKNYAKRKKPLLFIPREPVQPLVIHLGNSSESESEEEEDDDNSGDNILASLDKLIESAKNNAESPTECDKKEQVLLTKSQETNDKLEEIAQIKKQEAKKQLQLRGIFTDLLSKLTSACSTYKEDQQLFNIVKLQANRKKSAFVASQLEVNRLKEQLTAAQKMKNDNQVLMYAANFKLAAVQKAMIKKRSLIEDLRKECSKRGTQIFGPNYILPKFGANSPIKLRQKILGIK